MAIVEGWLTVIVAWVSWLTAVVAIVDGWLTAVVAMVVVWLTSRVAWLGSGLCFWSKPAEPWAVDESRPRSRSSGGSGGFGLFDPSLSSEEDIQRSSMSLKIRRNSR